MSGTLALSSVIAALDREGLTRLVRARRISSPTGVSDPLDLAAELLRPESISQALSELSRDELAALAGVATPPAPAAAARLLALGLTAADGSELPEVSDALAPLLEARGISVAELGSSGEFTAAVTAPEPATGDAGAAAVPAGDGVESGTADTSTWYAAALTTTAQTAWLLRDLTRGAAKLNRNGGVASAWLRSVEDRLRLTGVEELVTLLRAAGLAKQDGPWFVADADAWLAAEQEERWLALAVAAIGLMPAQLRAELSDATAGTRFSARIAGFVANHPLTTEATTTAIASAEALWERLGVTVDGALSDAGAQALTASVTPGARSTALGLPDPVQGVYIQPDLTIVVPGPLTAADETALATISMPEQLGVASMLRVSEASLSAAFDRGLDAATVRERLTALSLTGIPQPLDYLITAVGERAGSIVVSPWNDDDGRSRIDFARPELRSTVLVDRRLAHLQLREGIPELGSVAPLISRLRADHVLAALLDARYPARAEQDPATGELPLPGAAHVAGDSGSGAPHSGSPDAAHGSGAAGDAGAPGAAGAPATSARSGAEAPGAPADAAQLDPLSALVERVLESSADGPGDIGRQVALAIRDRSQLRVTVEIRGERREFTIVPVSLAAGRMRALDEAAGVERTLPIDAITAVAQS